MLLAHHPAATAALREPTVHDPWRVLVSGCLAGWGCGVDGTDYGLTRARGDWWSSAKLHLFPFCPEQHALGTPRSMPDIHGGDGVDVLAGRARVLDEHGNDLTAPLLEAGIPVLSQRDHRTLALLRTRIDPTFDLPADARDHHTHPWVLEHLPGPHPRA
jgi:hypothetical protein